MRQVNGQRKTSYMLHSSVGHNRNGPQVSERTAPGFDPANLNPAMSHGMTRFQCCNGALDLSHSGLSSKIYVIADFGRQRCSSRVIVEGIVEARGERTLEYIFDHVITYITSYPKNSGQVKVFHFSCVRECTISYETSEARIGADIGT